MAFNEDTRVKIPAILHLTQLGYDYISSSDGEFAVHKAKFSSYLCVKYHYIA